MTLQSSPWGGKFKKLSYEKQNGLHRNTLVKAILFSWGVTWLIRDVDAINVKMSSQICDMLRRRRIDAGQAAQIPFAWINPCFVPEE